MIEVKLCFMNAFRILSPMIVNSGDQYQAKPGGLFCSLHDHASYSIAAQVRPLLRLT